MIKKRDLLLVLPLLLLALLLFLIIRPEHHQTAEYVRIWVNSELYGEYPLQFGHEIVIEQETGEKNVLQMTEDGFFMASSTCHNQLCVSQGTVSESNYSRRSLGTHIICLPNRIDAELVLSAEPSDPLLPDI